MFICIHVAYYHGICRVAPEKIAYPFLWRISYGDYTTMFLLKSIEKSRIWKKKHKKNISISVYFWDVTYAKPTRRWYQSSYGFSPIKSAFIARCKLVVGQDASEMASAIVRANDVRTRCSPQPDVLAPTE